MAPTIDLHATTLLIAALAALAAGIAGPALARLTATRSGAQPAEDATDAEITLLETLAAHPAQLIRVRGALTAKDFTGPRAALYDTLRSAASRIGLDAIDDPTGRQRQTDAAIADITGTVDTDGWADALADAWDTLADDAGVTRYDNLDRTGTLDELRDRILAAGQQVLEASNGRDLTGAASPVELDPSTGRWTRRFVPASRARHVVLTAAAAAAGAFAVVAGAGAHPDSAATAALAAAALAVLGLGGIVVAAVDADTYFIDQPVHWATTAAAWALAAAAAVTAGEPDRLLAGVAIAAGIAVGFEVIVKLYSTVRPNVTQGLGDTMLVVATSGVPAAVTGNWMLGLVAVLAGSVTLAACWAALRAAGKVRADTPIAYGPYLVAGWSIGWILSAAGLLGFFYPAA